LTKGWNAGWTKDPGSDKVTVVVSSWTDTEIVLFGFAGAYGSGQNVLGAGDDISLQVWNAQTGLGPASYRVVVSALVSSNSPVKDNGLRGPSNAERRDEESQMTLMPTVSKPATEQEGNAVPTPVEVFPKSPPNATRLPYRAVQSPPVSPMIHSADARVEIKTDGDRRGTLDLFSDHVEYRDDGMGTGGGRAPYGPNPDNNFAVQCAEIANINSYGFRPIVFGSYEVVISARRRKFHIPALNGKTLAKAIRDKCGPNLGSDH
jgi:hypothetical protein